MKIINLTPHTINIVDGNNQPLFNITPSGEVARVTVSRVQVGTLNGVPVNKALFGEIENLPEPKEGVIYIVSAIVANAAKRDDVVIPDDTVRDSDGRIIGCRAFARVD